MEREQIIANVEAAIEALGAVGDRAKIEIQRGGLVFIGSWRDDEYACASGKTAAEAVDRLDERHAQLAQEAADREAFEAWKREQEKVAA